MGGNNHGGFAQEVKVKRIFFLFFAITLLIMLVGPSFLEGFYANLLLQAGFSFLMVGTLIAMQIHRFHVMMALILGSAYLVCNWLSIYYRVEEWIIVSKILLCLLIVGLIYFIGEKVLTAPIIDTDLVFGSIMIYLLVGILWSRLYWMVAALIPNSFAGIGPFDPLHYNLDEAASVQYNLVYFSYSTLGTLGIGDITAMHPIGKALTIFEAVTGQLFIAIAIAKLVSVWRMQTTQDQLQPIGKRPFYRPIFLLLLSLVLAIILVAPCLSDLYQANVFLQICYNLLTIALIYTLLADRLFVPLGASLAIFSLIFSWLSIHYDSLLYLSINLTCLCAFLIFSIFGLAKMVLKEPIIDTNLIFGTILIYFLGGICFSNIYWLNEIFSPGSFEGINHSSLQGSFHAGIQNQFNLFYYSFSTSASLGLGDIAPIHKFSKALTILELIFGQLFVAITVSKMVTVWRVR